MKMIVKIVVIGCVIYTVTAIIQNYSGYHNRLASLDRPDIYRYKDANGQWHYTDKEQLPEIYRDQAEIVDDSTANNLDLPPLLKSTEKEVSIVDGFLLYIETLFKGDEVLEKAQAVAERAKERQEALESINEPAPQP